jgi:hypothetical protein
MYECLMNTLRSFFGSGVLRTALFTAIILVSLAVVASLSPSFRKIVENLKEKSGLRGMVVDLATGIFKLSVVLISLRLLIVALNYQADVFTRDHGRITERNRSAILMKWGHPHEQRELYISHKRPRIWVTRKLLIKTDAKTSKFYTETFWKDKKQPVNPVNGKMPVILSENEEMKLIDVPQRSILSGDISIILKNNPRKLGNANYAGYNDIWNLKYLIRNKSEWDTAATILFKLPANKGFFDKMSLKIDGVDKLDNARTEDNGVSLKIPMKSGATKEIEIGYHSRGLEYIRYIPARMSRSAHYRVSMKIEGIPPKKLDYPIGSMPPIENISDLSANSYTLHWQLDNALTSYDIGIKLPDAEQPEYHFAMLLSEAPVGLLMLLLALLIPPLILRETVKLEIILPISVLYCLHYTFMGHLADLMSGFVNPFMLSTVVMACLVSIFRLTIGNTSKYLKYQDFSFFLIMILFYPLCVISENNAFWMQILYIFFISYLCFLIAGKILWKNLYDTKSISS